jgi:hypothetical protein
MSRTHNRILLKTQGTHTKEAPAGGTGILPGCCLSLTNAGAVVTQAAAKAEAIKSVMRVALEDALQGHSVDDEYTNGETVFYCEPQPGDEVNLLIKAAENIAIGDKINPEGATKFFVEAAGGDAAYMFEALEALNPVPAGGALVRCVRLS